MTEPSPARASFVDINVAGWLAARRYGMSERVVAEATERRLAGDWRGACAAAGVDIAFDPKDIADGYGTEIAEQLDDDLRHLVPDLVRWHLPRQARGGSGLLKPDYQAILARYADGLALYVATPPHLERPQRLILNCGKPASPGGAQDRFDPWTDARYLWDSRATHLLLARVGGGDRTPFFDRDGRRRTPDELAAAPDDDPVATVERVTELQDDGRLEEAWALGGITADFTEPESRWSYRRNGQTYADSLSATVPNVAAVVHRMLRSKVRAASETVMVRATAGWGAASVAIRLVDGQLRAARFDQYQSREFPKVPRPEWQRYPDVELLRTGVIGTDEVHPLVRAALFPDEPDPGFRVRLPRPRTATVPVRCRGQWHRVGWQGGRVTPADHPPEEAQRERVMRSLGGAVPGCFTVTETWRGSVASRLPRVLRELRAHALATLMHGAGEEFARLLDDGVDPAGIRDRWRRGPLHQLAKVDGESLLSRLLDAGMDINERDGKGRTPLAQVLFDGGSAGLVRAMLDAGADPTATDDTSCTMLHLLRSSDAERIVPWLVGAGVDPNAYDSYGRTPLMSQIRCSAPAVVMRATLAAGADPAATDEYTEEPVVSVIGEMDRDDLDFLAAAARGGEE